MRNIVERLSAHAEMLLFAVSASLLVIGGVAWLVDRQPVADAVWVATG